MAKVIQHNEVASRIFHVVYGCGQMRASGIVPIAYRWFATNKSEVSILEPEFDVTRLNQRLSRMVAILPCQEESTDGVLQTDLILIDKTPVTFASHSGESDCYYYVDGQHSYAVVTLDDSTGHTTTQLSRYICTPMCDMSDRRQHGESDTNVWLLRTYGMRIQREAAERLGDVERITLTIADMHTTLPPITNKPVYDPALYQLGQQGMFRWMGFVSQLHEFDVKMRYWHGFEIPMVVESKEPPTEEIAAPITKVSSAVGTSDDEADDASATKREQPTPKQRRALVRAAQRLASAGKTSVGVMSKILSTGFDLFVKLGAV